MSTVIFLVGLGGLIFLAAAVITMPFRSKEEREVSPQAYIVPFLFILAATAAKYLGM